MEEVLAKPHAVAGPEEIFEVVAPAVDELLAVDELVDQLSAFIGVLVFHESQQFVDRGNASGGIQISPAHELSVTCQSGMWNAVFFHAPEDVCIDEVTAWNEAGFPGRAGAKIRCLLG